MSFIIWTTIAGLLVKRKGQDTRKPADATATTAVTDAADFWRNSVGSQVFFGLPTYLGMKVWPAMLTLSPTKQKTAGSGARTHHAHAVGQHSSQQRGRRQGCLAQHNLVCLGPHPQQISSQVRGHLKGIPIALSESGRCAQMNT